MVVPDSRSSNEKQAQRHASSIRSPRSLFFVPLLASPRLALPRHAFHPSFLPSFLASRKVAGWIRPFAESQSWKHKTLDDITHPFPDYPFEKLFSRRRTRSALERWRSISPRVEAQRKKEREREILRARARPSSLGGMREKFPREGKSRSRSNINRAFRRINWQRPFYSSRPTGICPRSRYTNTLPLLPSLSFFPRLARVETTNRCTKKRFFATNRNLL